jgi:hypothetical protein
LTVKQVELANANAVNTRENKTPAPASPKGARIEDEIGKFEDFSLRKGILLTSFF